jgi:hypothetical protein
MSEPGATFDLTTALLREWEEPTARSWARSVKPRDWEIMSARREPSSMRARRQPLTADELAHMADKALWLAGVGDYELAYAQVEAIAAEGDSPLTDALQVQIEAVQAGLDRRERAA